MTKSVISAKTLPDMVDFLGRRRSTKVKDLCEPGPSAEQIESILTIGSRVPDHGKMVPWRFIVIGGDSRIKIGSDLRIAYMHEDPAASEAKLDLESERFTRAPLVIAVVSSPKESTKAPEWEQILSAGAACFNICLAANAMGFASTWLTEWYAYNPIFQKSMNLSDHEKFAGFIYIGHNKAAPEERERPVINEIVRYL